MNKLTSDRLRQIAAVIELYDLVFQAVDEQVTVKDSPVGTWDFVRRNQSSTAMQDDLRRWADEIDAKEIGIWRKVSEYDE